MYGLPPRYRQYYVSVYMQGWLKCNISLEYGQKLHQKYSSKWYILSQNCEDFPPKANFLGNEIPICVHVYDLLWVSVTPKDSLQLNIICQVARHLVWLGCSEDAP